MLKATAAFTFLTLIASLSFGQGAADPWLRILTGDDLVVDVDKNSLVLKPGGIVSADFRSSYSKPEPIGQGSTQQYASRIDSIEFKIAEPQYRLAKSSFRDSSGSSIYESSAKEGIWKRRMGGSSYRFYGAISKLAPFGSWKVLTYRYASGEGPSDEDPRSLRDLVGSAIQIKPSYLFIGSSNCVNAELDFKPIADKDLARYGLSLKDFGVTAPSISVIFATCKSNKDYPPQMFIFLESSSKAKLLWDGVFFDIERPANVFTP